MAHYRFAPSDLTFLADECQLCLYLKYRHKFIRPRGPMPKIFNIIHHRLKEYFNERQTLGVIDELPPGIFRHGERWVKSAPLQLPGRSSTCSINGRLDMMIDFNHGGFAVIDFKTAESRDVHVPLYSRQLHAYAIALEQPAQGEMPISPVEHLGLLCVEPCDMVHLGDLRNGAYAYEARMTWINCPRDDNTFIGFLGDIVDVLDRPEPPPGSADCVYCIYRDTARRVCL